MHKASRRTKIIATLGPSSLATETLIAMIRAGVDLVRINFSHGSTNEQVQLIHQARHAAKKVGKEIGIIADIQGPKIRIRQFKSGKVTLEKGQHFTLDCSRKGLGDETVVGIDNPLLYKKVSTEDLLLLDDGLISLKVVSINRDKIHCVVIVGGSLRDNKGLNRLGGGLVSSELSPKSIKDLKTALQANVDYIALSFISKAIDIEVARKQIADFGHAAIIAKIECAEALNNIDEIILAADAVMVARGDLGVEIGPAEVPFEQKRIIERARKLNRAVITATQMMESMCTKQQPTRAEVSDVANAVIDGTDAVMFSAETAIGQYPVSVIETTQKICLSAEKRRSSFTSGHRLECLFNSTNEAIAMAAMYTANHYSVKAIISLTESGSTPLLMSRIRSNIPIYALTSHLKSFRKMTLYRGVFPMLFSLERLKDNGLIDKAINQVMTSKLIEPGDNIIYTRGTNLGHVGETDSLKLIKLKTQDPL